jgi:hypothetical protein
VTEDRLDFRFTIYDFASRFSILAALTRATVSRFPAFLLFRPPGFSVSGFEHFSLPPAQYTTLFNGYSIMPSAPKALS